MNTCGDKEVFFVVVDVSLPGGIERFVANLSSLLIQHGSSVTIFSLHRTFRKPFYEFDSRAKLVFVTEMPFVGGFYKLSTFWACLKFSKLIRQTLRPFTLLSTHPITTIYLRFLYPKLMQFIVASEHSTYSAHNAIIRKLRAWAYRSVKCVVTQTRSGVDQFRACGLEAVQIPNPVTEFLDDYQWKECLVAETFAIPTCLSIARFETVKQLDHYIEAAKIVKQTRPDIQFLLVGKGPEEGGLKRLVEEAEVANVFKVIQATAHVSKFFRQSQVYIISSASEAFPMTMLEALSFGLPVIAYDQLIGPKEVIKDGYNGYLVSQNEPQAIAEKILAIFRDKVLLKKLRASALDSASQYSGKSVLDRWLEVL